MTKFLFSLIFLLFVYLGTAQAQVCKETEALVRSGDVLFLDIDDYLFRQVAAATRSWTSHVGIGLRDDKGQLWIFESTTPKSRKVSMCEFMDQG
jgi:hypothetical protein